MTVYILEPDDRVVAVNRLVARIGFVARGAEVVMFREEAFDDLPLQAEDIVVGGVGFAQRAMRRLGIEPHSLLDLGDPGRTGRDDQREPQPRLVDDAQQAQAVADAAGPRERDDEMIHAAASALAPVTSAARCGLVPTCTVTIPNVWLWTTTSSRPHSSTIRASSLRSGNASTERGR